MRVAKLPMSAVLRTKTVDEPRSLMMVLVDAGDDRILGFAMIGAEAGEVTAAVQTAMLAGPPYTGVRDAILVQPMISAWSFDQKGDREQVFGSQPEPSGECRLEGGARTAHVRVWHSRV